MILNAEMSTCLRSSLQPQPRQHAFSLAPIRRWCLLLCFATELGSFGHGSHNLVSIQVHQSDIWTGMVSNAFHLSFKTPQPAGMMRYHEVLVKMPWLIASSPFCVCAILTTTHLSDAPEVAQLNLYCGAIQSPTNKFWSGLLSRDRKVMCPYRHDAMT